MEYLILFLPLIGSIISGFFGKTIGDRLSQLITCILVSISALLSLFIFFKVVSSGYEHNAIIATWINSGSLNVNWSIKVDALSAVMLVVVTLVSSLVHIYSVGYMSHDPHKPRFMSYLSLFTFAMLTLVTSDNFLQLFFGWEGVGLCSYFLIGFWYKKETANAAAIKAFIAAAFAESFLNQKPIKKYEQSPTPSHPKNNCKKLSDVTKVNIAKVKSDKYAINLGLCLSCDI